MKGNSGSNVDQKTKDKIVHEWKTRRLNSIPIIAKEFELSQYIINKIVNNYLSTKSTEL
ncbi:hypothetical protein [Flavobacterium sp. UGB4466]|uniref:hypothetical protein n=1 Tax=Flavobacterium sp. UGB4466 TaxID=2730889 RepID=UPI00192B1C5F|nr:hypothetical protein [Flavobacterium sp. UGB4466]